jgi:DNA repair exonuclease SbcCD ATPase subunit
MILRSLALANWRVHTDLKLQFGPHLNLISGRNESGKSSLVEALDWALYRDLSARIKVDEIRAIVPAFDTSARPRVELEIEFADCRATISKILSEEASKREASLCIRREGKRDEFFERAEAQTRLQALFAADGLGTERGSGAESTLLVAHQGEGVEFLSDGGSAIRSTLGVGDNGEIALTRRLENVRVEIEKARKKELLLDLPARAIDAARAGTEAARVRDELRAAHEARAQSDALRGEIEELRDDIEKVDAELQRLIPRQKKAGRVIDELGELITRQREIDSAVREAEFAAREARSARETLKKRAGEIARLESELAEMRSELERVSGGLDEKKSALERAQTTSETARDSVEIAARAWDEARERVSAWRAVWDVYEAQTRLKEQKTGLETLQMLGVALQETEIALKNSPRPPALNELRAARTAWESLQRLQNEATQSLQIELSPNTSGSARWKADNGEVETLELVAGEKIALGALARAALQLPGATLKLNVGARGVDELRDEIETARGRLKSLVDEWKLGLESLPDSLDELEARRHSYEELLRARDEAVANLKREEARFGSLYQAQARVDEAESEFAAFKEAVKAFENLISFRGLKRAEVKSALDGALAWERQTSTNTSRARNHFNTCAQALREAQQTLVDAQNRPDAMRAAIEAREAQLARERDDEMADDAAREARLQELGAEFLQAEQRREAKQSARRELGDGVSQWRVEEARKESLKLTEERGEMEKRLVALRTTLSIACEQDPDARVQELEAQIALLEPEVARHEARLRGMALLDAALFAERARLSRDLAGPLNTQLGPWLSTLRGKETRLSFDGSGTRIESVQTSDAQHTISLPFSEHSEGMKEQVAFALRLILAGRVAKNLPSGRLPVILDDPFTQSDSSRRAGLGEVLGEALQQLQIIFVTCHPAPEVAELDVQNITLGQGIEADALN